MRAPSDRLKQSGQATAEYILLIAIIVLIFLAVFKGILAPALGKFRKSLNQRVDQMFQGDNLHRLPGR